jgi:GH15 family glucan-1,4-alpha-glucosidase
VGDGRSVALVSRGGSIDWLCWPDFGSPSIFAGLLDSDRGGKWSISAAAPVDSHRAYIDHTNVLRTVHRTQSGALQITDFMPAVSEDEKRSSLWPEQELIRVVECIDRNVDVDVRFDPRPDYGRKQPATVERGALGLRIETTSGLVALHTSAPIRADPRGGFGCSLRLRTGECVPFVLTRSADGPAVIPALEWRTKLDTTIRWWRHWLAPCGYQGRHQEAVIRSALVVKLLMYAPSGAIAAAPTTSLPEKPGGDLNWDYRFCWLRDAAFTARALLGLGFRDEATAFVSWLLHATRLTLPKLMILYDIWGRKTESERLLPHLRGYEGASPVRVGNAAAWQIQLDVYGEVVDAVMELARSGEKLDRETQKLLRRIGNYVCRHWQEPDAGIWESRDDLRHYTHSKLMCWVALDRLLEMARRGWLRGLDIEECEKNRRELRDYIESRGWDTGIGSYVQFLGGDSVDASLLGMALFGFADPACERMRQTHTRIETRLSRALALVDRHEKSRPTGEGAFGACCFWNVDFLARGGGSLARAEERFDRVLAYANDVGLFAEEIDPTSGELLGNFPQAFTHVALINAALRLAERRRRANAASQSVARRDETTEARL